MARIFVVADAKSRAALRDWFQDERIASATHRCPTAYIGLPGDNTESTSGDDVPTMQMDELGASLQEQDIVIIAGPRFEHAVGELLRRGIRNLFDGNEILSFSAADDRFLRAASRSYIGPTEPVGHGLPVSEAARFDIQPIKAGSVPAHKLFIVNSMPKSGTLWLAAMLEGVLGVRSREQITISHVGDLEQDWNKPNNHAAVTLVRDLRAVVVSWFHHARRADLDLGFRTARYPTIECFYWQHFLGTVRTTRRFYGGDLERWLDLVAANYVPIFRFEDLVADTRGCLRRLADAWRIEVTDEMLARVVSDFSFENMRESIRGSDGYIADMVNRGHLRRGQVAAWKDELPPEIAADIQTRFKGYQARLGYGDDV